MSMGLQSGRTAGLGPSYQTPHATGGQAEFRLVVRVLGRLFQLVHVGIDRLGDHQRRNTVETPEFPSHGQAIGHPRQGIRAILAPARRVIDLPGFRVLLQHQHLPMQLRMLRDIDRPS